MSNALYYSYLVTLCDKAGDFVRVKALFYDVRDGSKFGSIASPESIKTLAKYYDGDINALENAYKKSRNAANDAWASIVEILKNEERYDSKKASLFYQQLVKTTDNCDFRQKVRDWARAELRKEQKGKTSTFYDFGDLVDRYQKLILKRQEKK